MNQTPDRDARGELMAEWTRKNLSKMMDEPGVNGALVCHIPDRTPPPRPNH